MEFFEDAFPEYKPRLLPDDPFDRAYVRLWVDHVAKQVVPAFMRTVMAQEPEKQKENLEEYYKALRAFTDKVKGPYFLGEQFSLVDAALAPWVVRDYIIAENRGYSREAVGDKWKAYAEKVETRESVLKTISVSPSQLISRSKMLMKRNRRRNTMRRFMRGTCATKRRARQRKR